MATSQRLTSTPFVTNGTRQRAFVRSLEIISDGVQNHKDYGAWQNTPRFRSVTLSPTNRLKRGDLGRQPKTRSGPAPDFAANEGLLLLGLRTANLLHTARTRMAAGHRAAMESPDVP
jgi:hypothetical protein